MLSGGRWTVVSKHAFDDEFAALAKTDAVARRLVSIPGIGVLNATALVVATENPIHTVVDWQIG